MALGTALSGVPKHSSSDSRAGRSVVLGAPEIRPRKRRGAIRSEGAKPLTRLRPARPPRNSQRFYPRTICRCPCRLPASLDSLFWRLTAVRGEILPCIEALLRTALLYEALATE
jgi:hypothetical protein